MYNKITLIGNLTRDIEYKIIGNGSALAKSSIATSYKYKTNNGEQKEEICFLDFSIFGKLADVANNYLRKGSKVLLDGRLILEQWTAQDGTNKSKHSLRVETLKMLDSNPNNSSYQSNNSSNLDKSNVKMKLDKEFLEDLEKCPF